MADAFLARLAGARATWPGIHVDGERFARFVAERAERGREGDLAFDDLYLACACSDGDAAAIAAFDRAFSPAIDRAIASVGATSEEAADLRQVVRQRLLVPPAGEHGERTVPRIATYSGRGSLAAWIRVIAIREAQRLLPRERREKTDSDDAIDRLIAPDDGPELGYLKRLYRAEFREAFAAAIASLAAKERLLLQQHALDGLGIDKLATFYKVHRATAARWVEAARQAVLDGTRKELIRRLGLSQHELDSLLRLISSQLSVSLPRLLRE